MKIEIIQIYPEKPDVALTAYCPGGEGGKPAIIVLPGGGYAACAQGEGEPVARYFAERGYAAFVLNYSTLYQSFDPASRKQPNASALFPGPLLDLGRAVLTVRERAAEFGVDPQRIALCGFSAGGHLAASYVTGWNGGELKALGAPPEMLRVAAVVLCYPTIDLNSLPERKKKDNTMIQAVFGTPEPTREQLDSRSPFLHVTADTPPVFIWHTADDATTPVKHAIVMAAALEAAGVPFELHIFDHGPHAAALSEGLPAEPWPGLAVSFLNRHLSAF